MTRQVADNLFRGQGDATRLLAGRHRDSGKLKFPFPPGPDGESYDIVELSPAGKLWSYTVQRFRPKTPYNGSGTEADFKPYGVGYIELPGELIVESRIVADDFGALEIGQPMRITTEAYREDEGEAVLTYAFAPVPEGERA